MAKFKKGDNLRCVLGKSQDFQLFASDGRRGSGWRLGFSFKVKEITNNLEIPIYWPGINGHGIFEPFIELVNIDWDE